jgi:hypothetical protein
VQECVYRVARRSTNPPPRGFGRTPGFGRRDARRNGSMPVRARKDGPSSWVGGDNGRKGHEPAEPIGSFGPGGLPNEFSVNARRPLSPWTAAPARRGTTGAEVTS